VVHVYDVTDKDIRRFAQAIDDPNPLYYDEEYAKKTIYKGIIAPPYSAMRSHLLMSQLAACVRMGCQKSWMCHCPSIGPLEVVALLKWARS